MAQLIVVIHPRKNRSPRDMRLEPLLLDGRDVARGIDKARCVPCRATPYRDRVTASQRTAAQVLAIHVGDFDSPRAEGLSDAAISITALS